MRIHVNAKSVERRRATTLALSVVAVATIATSSGSMIGPPPLGRVSHNETIITTTPIWESSSEQQLQRRLRRGLLRSSTRDDESSLLSVSASDVETQVVLLSPRQGPRRLVTTGDNLKVLVVLCRFTDHVDDRVLPTREYFDQLFNGGGEGDGSGSSDPSVVNPVGSVREWLESNSNGRYKVTFDVQDWKTTANTEAYYANGESGLRGNEIMQEMFKPILDELANSGYDFMPLDSDMWGDLDQFFVIHSGYSAELGEPPEGCALNPKSNRIWSQGSATTPNNGWVSPDGAYTVSSFGMTGAFDEGLCQGKPAEMGVIVHEFLHEFGLPEMYDEDYEEAPIPLGGIGKFSIMSNIYGWKRNMKIPGSLDPWCKVELTWLDPIEITVDGFYPIQPTEISSQIYVIKKNFPEGELLYIENRQPMKWDSDWDGSGILIYKVDNSRTGQSTRGFPGHPNWPNDRYRVTLLQADGLWEIEKGESPGNAGDFWTNGQKLSPGGDYPNTDSFSAGQAPTGISIEILTESQYIMLFQVSGLA